MCGGSLTAVSLLADPLPPGHNGVPLARVGHVALRQYWCPRLGWKGEECWCKALEKLLSSL